MPKVSLCGGTGHIFVKFNIKLGELLRFKLIIFCYIE